MKNNNVHSWHNMFTTLKAKNEAKAIKWVNNLEKEKRNSLATYWTLHGFGHYVAYLKTGG
jgi:hypothetical protein